MIYQYVKRYLKSTLKEPKLNYPWSMLDNVQFMNYIKQRYTEEEFAKGISEVKIAFQDFFDPVGNIVFRYKENNGIKFKVFPYRVKVQNSKHLKNIIKIIKNNQQQVQYPYLGQNDQIAIMGKIRREINKETFQTQESINVRELITYAIRISLNLKDEDIITQLKRKYIIKIFNKNTILDIENEVAAPVKREGKSNRFNGYSAEEIEETYKDIFKKNGASIDNFLKTIMQTIFENDLNFRIIDNKYYENKSLTIIHHQITQELTNYTKIEGDYLLGVAGFLMRKHFYKIHELMAIELIECIYEKNINANDFLLFYNGNTVLMNNNKYIIPSLESADGKQWNNSSLIGICNLWMNTKKKKETYEQKLLETNMKLQEIEKKLSYIQPEKKLQESIILKTESKLKAFLKQHEELQSKLHYLENTRLNSTEYFVLEKEVTESSLKLKKLQDTIKEATHKLQVIKDTNITTYSELEYFSNQKKLLLQDIKVQNLNVDSKNVQIDPIIESIVKVLMQRTKLVQNK